MPDCINGEGTYKGTEPSPKGLGYCAKHEDWDTLRKGRDGKYWIVRSYETGNRWVKVKDFDGHVKRYDLKSKGGFFSSPSTKKMVGLELKEGYMYKMKADGDFETTETPIPSGSKSVYHVHGPSMPENAKGLDSYNILDNDLTSFVVHVDKSKNEVHIYDPDTKMLAKKIKYIRIFVGASPLNKATKRSGGHGDKYLGNSILLQTAKKTYVYIGATVYKFKAAYEIETYSSPVGNNGVPYPWAADVYGNKYLMAEERVVDMVFDDIEDPYHILYNPSEAIKEAVEIKNESMNVDVIIPYRR